MNDKETFFTSGAEANTEYLECEKNWVYDMLIVAAGWFGA